MSKEEKKLEILGKPVEEATKKDGSTIYTMRSADFDAILADNGITKEVKATVSSATDLIAEAAVKFLHARCKEHEGEKCVARLGNGNLSQEIAIVGHKVHTGKDIRTGEPYTSEKFGVVTASLNYQFARAMRAEGGLLDEVAKDMESFYKKRVKK